MGRFLFWGFWETGLPSQSSLRDASSPGSGMPSPSPKVTERARPLTRNHRRSDSIALTKGLHPDEFPLIMYNFFEM